MISAELQRAIDNLKIQDVYLHDLSASCAGDFDPKYDEGVAEFELHWMHIVRSASVIEFEAGERLLKVFVRVGVRWVDSNGEDQDEGKDEELSVRVAIEAEFIAEYQITAELEQACIDEFCLKNVSYHVWPYWRELLSSQCSRMHLPKLMLPAVQLAQNRHQQVNALESTEELTEGQ